MQDRRGFLPGYTGHIPKQPKPDEVLNQGGPRPHIPNYQGFIPGVKSENLFGKTYGQVTETSALNTYNKGRDLPLEEKFKTVTQDNYTNQMRIPVMPLRPKEYPAPPEDPLSKIPIDTQSKFWGVKPGISTPEIQQSAEKFFAPGANLRRSEPPRQDLSKAAGEFWAESEGYDPTAGPKMSYSEARRLATQIRTQGGR